MFSIKMLMLTEAPRTIINGSYGSNFKAIFDILKVAKQLAVVERLFWQLGTRFSGRCRCREV